jgi:thioredoxin reductase
MDSDSVQAKGIKALSTLGEITDQTHDLQTKYAASRFTPERYLDENEREWLALDEMCRSRPWATRKDEIYEYPFRQPTEDMMKVEGKWKGWAGERKNTRGEIVGEKIKQVIIPQEFPPDYRVILFTPEFGNDRSFDTENWSYLEPENKVDVWVISWQGWNNVEEMIDQVQHTLLSFADAVSTTWFGQGVGALVAYELLKMLDNRNDQSPNLPVSLVVCDCPAPHLFAENYKPFDMDGFSEAKKSDKIAGLQAKVIEDDSKIIKEYTFKHGDNKGLPIPITALCHDGNPNAPEDSVKEWEAYSKEDKFEFVDPLEEEEVEMEEYLRGKGYALNIDPAVVATCTQHNEEFRRRLFEEYADIGPTDGDIPEEIDDMVIGCGINGLTIGMSLAKSGKNVYCFDKYHEIGGIWSFYANDYSRVNTSEIGYRITQPEGRWARCNEDHTPRYYIMKDFYQNTADHLYGKCRLKMEITKVDSPERKGDPYIVHYKNLTTGKESTIKAVAVHWAINRRLGAQRVITYPGLDRFKGKELYGYAGENKGLVFWAKDAIVVGAGAFAFENVRTVIEHGSKMCTMLCRRHGTASPKWIDQLAFFRPRDEFFGLHKAADMISFEAWRNCYVKGGIQTPTCWDEGLLKPHNHTISTSDLVFIGAFHGMFSLVQGEIKEYRADGRGVDLLDGTTLDCDYVIKCTGFHFETGVERMTGCSKMYPWHQLRKNMFYFGEPLLDGGQFGGGKGTISTEEQDKGKPDEALVKKGYEVLHNAGYQYKHLIARHNPFGSGVGGPLQVFSNYIVWMRDHPDEQDALLEVAGAPAQSTTELWASQQGVHQALVGMKVASHVAKAVE